MIRLTVPAIDDDDLRAVQEVLESGFLVQGQRVEAFEAEVARRTGSACAVAVSSGTAALHLALRVLGVGDGDFVLTTAYSWIATANVIELCGARPVFADIEPDTFNLSAQAAGDALDRLARIGKIDRVQAVLPVHTFGQMADLEAIRAVTERHHVPILEDAACALGASRRDAKGNQRPAGAWGAIGCFSFHPRKTVTTGEGGLCVTDDPALARRLRILRNHGIDPEGDTKGQFVEPGFNYRMTEFQAALAITQLAKLDRLLSARLERADRYDALLADTPLAPPAVGSGNRHAYQSYIVLLPSPVASQREKIIAALKQRGVETSIGTIHIPLTSYYRTAYGYEPGDFPVTDDVAARSLALPLHAELSPPQQERVVELLLDELGKSQGTAGT